MCYDVYVYMPCMCDVFLKYTFLNPTSLYALLRRLLVVYHSIVDDLQKANSMHILKVSQTN